MRLLNNDMDEESMTSVLNFTKWILDIGDGKVPTIKLNEEQEETTWIKIPDDLLIKYDGNCVQ